MFFDALSSNEEDDNFKPTLPEMHEWTLNEKLKKEKLVLGFYWSGHPLNQYKALLLSWKI
ncbi:MAG: hypothetical protein B1H06_04370 [Candidatus Cloacimonas sp. 4484_143]|nr:MAG: hypothetical protein B1H06_04370 [Candidatus Cloacimonas sp. 4484_143]